MAERTLADIAQQAGVSPSTLRRWVREGIVPLRDGRWTGAAAAQARLVARLRARGHGLEPIRQAARSGRLAFGLMEDLFPSPEGRYSMTEVAEELGLEEELLRRIWTALGIPGAQMETVGEDDLQLLRYLAAVLDAGFPLVAFLQMLRVYGQAVATIADTEVRLFHLYVHEPLIRDGVDGIAMAEEMEGLARDVMPLASPIMDHLHQRFLHFFVEQDLVGHIERETGGETDSSRLRVGIAFADLTGYTRLTEEAGEEEALDVVERFVREVGQTLPDEARIVKTIGDAVMVVSADAAGLTAWAVRFQAGRTERPLPRIGIHLGSVIYRDGDYFGTAVNLASRVGARAAGGEVLVTSDVRAAAPAGLAFERIGEVRMKGFSAPTELYLAQAG